MGINIKEMIAKTLINDNPVDNHKIHILLISKLYLQILNFLYFDFSSFSCIVISSKFFLIVSYIFKKYKQIFETDLSY